MFICSNLHVEILEIKFAWGGGYSHSIFNAP